MRYIGKGTKGLQKTREEIQAGNDRVTIPVQVRWLSNPPTIREREHTGGIRASSVVFIVRGKKVAWRLVNKGATVAGVHYKSNCTGMRARVTVANPAVHGAT
jgi:hypothetical protein